MGVVGLKVVIFVIAELFEKENRKVEVIEKTRDLVPYSHKFGVSGLEEARFLQKQKTKSC